MAISKSYANALLGEEEVHFQWPHPQYSMSADRAGAKLLTLCFRLTTRCFVDIIYRKANRLKADEKRSCLNVSHRRKAKATAYCMTYICAINDAAA